MKLFQPLQFIKYNYKPPPAKEDPVHIYNPYNNTIYHMSKLDN